jgi:acyl carrier protein
MTKQEAIEKIKTIVKPYTNNTEALNILDEDTDFIKDLNINSANLVDIILDIEEAFNVIIDNAEMERMLTVKAAIEIIQSKATE